MHTDRFGPSWPSLPPGFPPSAQPSPILSRPIERSEEVDAGRGGYLPLYPQVALVVGLFIVLGAAVSIWTSQFVEKLLFGLTPRDPLTFAGAAAVLAAIGAAAGWLPAHSATVIEPAGVLCEE